MNEHEDICNGSRTAYTWWR